MIVHDQMALFGRPDPVAAQRAGLVVRIASKKACETIIRRLHYSRTVVWSSSENYLIHCDGKVVGAVQLGPPMNPASGGKIVSGGLPWIELNRMAYELPEGTFGTQVLSLSIRLLRHRRPDIQWVQSFADERCGKMGGIYQAASFQYLGSHVGEFYELDGEHYHRSIYGRKASDKRGWGCGPRIRHFVANQHRAKKVRFSQYRYVKLLTKAARRNLIMNPQPYPKEAP